MFLRSNQQFKRFICTFGSLGAIKHWKTSTLKMSKSLLTAISVISDQSRAEKSKSSKPPPWKKVTQLNHVKICQILSQKFQFDCWSMCCCCCCCIRAPRGTLKRPLPTPFPTSISVHQPHHYFQWILPLNISLRWHEIRKEPLKTPSGQTDGQNQRHFASVHGKRRRRRQKNSFSNL